jgi:hypothetical protein
VAYDKRSLDDYVDVAERITEFRDRYPAGTLRGTFQMIDIAGQAIVAYRAEAWRTEDDKAPGVGCAWELVPGRTPYTRGSELQNAETSAWGRAIIAVGAADAKRGVASRQEVALAQDREAERIARWQRRADPETDEHGAATAAEQERMTRGPEPGAWRSAGTAENDPWQDEPGQPLDPPAETAFGSISPQQQTRMFAMFTGLKMREREAQVAFIEKVIGERVASRKDLSYVQAGNVLEALEKASRA